MKGPRRQGERMVNPVDHRSLLRTFPSQVRMDG